MREQFNSFFKKCQDLVNQDRSDSVLSVTEGNRFLKIIITSGTNVSVFAFVDKNNGDVLKPASFKAPARHARGNVKRNGLHDFLWSRLLERIKHNDLLCI